MVDVFKIIPNELDIDSYYAVRVRTINAFGTPSRWSESLVVETDVGFRRFVWSDTGPIYYFEDGKVLFSLYESDEIRYNKLKNPSFENGLTGWTRYGTTAMVSINVSTTKLFGTSAGFAQVLVLTPTQQVGIQTDETQYAPALPDETWTGSAYVYPSNDGMYFTVNLKFYNSSLTQISEVVGQNKTGDNAVWLRVSTTAKAPANTAYVGMCIVMAKSTGVNRTIRVDGCLLEKTTSVRTYFDGSTYPGTTTWDATPAHTSSSTLAGATARVTINKDLYVGGSYNGVFQVYKQDAVNPTFVMNTDTMMLSALEGATFLMTDVVGNPMFEVQGPTGTVNSWGPIYARNALRVEGYGGFRLVGTLAAQAFMEMFTSGTLELPGARAGYVGFNTIDRLTINNDVDNGDIYIVTKGTGEIRLTGTVFLSDAPTAPTHAATKAYVDSSVFIPEIYTVASQAAMLALSATRGDYALRTDVSKTFILRNTPASTLGNWAELPSDASAAADQAVADHVALTDPHTQYLRESIATSTYVPLARLINTTAPLRIDGVASADLSTTITLSALVFTASATGIVPTGGTDATNYLRGNATWANPHNQITIDTFFRTGQFVSGGSIGTATRQIRLSYGSISNNYPHDILTMHNAAADTSNQIIFRTWKVGDPVAGPPSNTILTLDGALITAAKPVALPANPLSPLHASTMQYSEIAGANAVAAHVALGAEAHPEYLSEAEMDAAILAHATAPNPHPIYMTQAEADPLYVKILGDTMTGPLTMTGATADIFNTGTGRKIVGRQLKAVGGGGSGSPLVQLAFGFSGLENYEHQILTAHNSSVTASNQMIFRLWKLGDAHTIPTNTVLTLNGDLATFAYPVVIPLAAPTQPTYAANKQYVDDQVANQLTQAEADLLYVNITGDTMTAGTLTFAVSSGGAGRYGQHIGLYGNNSGLGAQTNNIYLRTPAGGSFRFYSGGIHNDAAANAGGGTELLNITDTGMQFKTRNIATELYVQSRGDNLVTNGSGLLLDNTNFSTFIYNPVYSYAGGGSFEAEGKGLYKATDELIPVDPSKRYRLAYAIMMLSKQQPADTPLHYGLVEASDADRFLISPNMVLKVVGSMMTTLAVQLNPGATTITLTSATGWYSGGGVPEGHIRTLAIYPYTNAQGYTYPAYTYTRNVYTDLWAAGAISGNVITLRVPWAGATWPVGTPVANAQSGGTFDYIAGIGVASPTTWTMYDGTIGLLEGETIPNTPFTPGTVVPGSGGFQQSTGGFRWGTAFVKIGWLLGYPAANLGTAKYVIDNVTFETIQQKSERYAFTVPTGTSPFTVASTTLVPNLNADMVDTKHATDFLWLSAGTDDPNRTIGGNLRFSSSDGRRINMYAGAKAGFGIQGSGVSMYSRAESSFYWYRGGFDDNNTEGNPGTGGTALMSLTDLTFKYKTFKIWHEGNDGVLSGLDADYLDGKDSIDFANREEMEALLGDLLFVGIYDAAKYMPLRDQFISFNNAVPNTITGWTFDPPADASCDFRVDCTIPVVAGGFNQRPIDGNLAFNFGGFSLSSYIRATDATSPTVATTYPAQVQTVTPTGVTAGTFTMTLLGVTTGPIQWNAIGTAVKSAINAAIPGNTITVSGGPVNSASFTLSFPGNYGDVSLVIINSTNLTGTLTAAITTSTGWGPGKRIQLRATWNAATDTITHYWRLSIKDLLDDITPWITFGNAPAAGKLLAETPIAQTIGGAATNYYTGQIYRVTASINSVPSFDFKGSDVPVAATVFTPTLGSTLTMVGAGMSPSVYQGPPKPEWSGGATPSQASTTYRHGMYWVCGSTRELDFVDADYSGRYDVPQTFTVTNKVLTSNVATLTIVLHKTIAASPVDIKHEIQVGKTIIVNDIDPVFDGKYTVTSTTPTTVSYSRVNTNISSTAVLPVGQLKYITDAPVSVTYGDWLIAIDPLHSTKVNAGIPDDDLTLSEVVFQYIPFSTETYVKQQIELHADPTRSPDPHSQYLLPAEADVAYAPMKHTHDADLNAAIIDHMDNRSWNVFAWSWANGIATLTVDYNHNLLPEAYFDLIGVQDEFDTRFNAATPAASTKRKVDDIASNLATPSFRYVRFLHSATPTGYTTSGYVVNLALPGTITNDPHPQYLNLSEADLMYAFKEHEHPYEPLGTMNAHVAQIDPHIQYLKETDAEVMYAKVDHNHDLVYAAIDHTHPLVYEVHSTDGANSAEIWIGATPPATPHTGDIWIDTLNIVLQKPSAPTNFTVSQYFYAPYLQISWSQWPVTEGVSSVTLQRSLTGLPGSFTTIKTLTAPILTPTNWLDSGATGGIVQNTVYYYRLYASNSQGAGTMTDIVKMSGNTPPLLPTGLSSINTGIGSQEFSWTVLGGHTYEVYFNGVSQGIQVPPVPKSGLAENTEYTFGVRAIDTAPAPNVPAYSAIAYVSTTTQNAVPPQLTGLTATSVTATSITVSWNAPSPAINDLLNYEVSASGPSISIKNTSSRTATFSSLTPLTNYLINVRARDRGTPALMSPNHPLIVATIGTDGTTLPPVVTLTSLKPEVIYGRMYARFTVPAGVTQYRVDRAEGSNGTPGLYGIDVNWTNTTAGAKAIALNGGTAYTQGKTIGCKVWTKNAAGHTNSIYFPPYTLLPSPIYVTADGTNHWRPVAGGQWNSSGNLRPFQGHYDAAYPNAKGFWFYGTQIKTALYNNGLRTVTLGYMLFKREACGLADGADPIVALHDITTNPGTITSDAGDPTLYGEYALTGLAVTMGGVAKWGTLPKEYVDLLVDGTYKGVAVHDPDGDPYMCFSTVSEYPTSGQLQFVHLG